MRWDEHADDLYDEDGQPLLGVLIGLLISLVIYGFAALVWWWL